MKRRGVIRLGSYVRAGRLLPRRAAGLRAGAVALRPGEVMDWHSTKSREELLIALRGWLHVEIGRSRGAARRIRLKSGQRLFLPTHTLHRVVNRSSRQARYIYVTALAR